VNKVEQFENKISRMEDKVEELDQAVKDYERMLRKYEWNMRDIWDTMKDQLMNHRIEGEKIQTKGNDNLLNRIIAKNFPNLQTESHPGAGNI
jgi:uncharacterized coiled-coil protein SlyX